LISECFCNFFFRVREKAKRAFTSEQFYNVTIKPGYNIDETNVPIEKTIFSKYSDDLVYMGMFAYLKKVFNKKEVNKVFENSD
jgi:hypothetical protein